MGQIITAEVRAITRRVAKEMCLAINDARPKSTSEKEILRSLRAVIMHQPKLAKITYSIAMTKVLCKEDNGSVCLAAAGEKKRRERRRPAGRQCQM